ncbi:MAG: CehA/McbA family metallohydrolase [Chloroflexota bacterium]
MTEPQVALEMDRHLTLDGRAANGPYAWLPFDVPPGIARLEIRYAYPGQQEAGSGNEIDLGLADPRGDSFPDFPGFRGWSGNFRREAVITPTFATPAYLPGDILPGTWKVLLGLYKLRPEGCPVKVAIRMWESPGEPPEDAVTLPTAASQSPASAVETEPRWFRGDLHSHTCHSDAPGSPRELAAAALQAGLDFLAVTDHNTSSHLPHVAAISPPLLLPGEEVTTYGGHMNVWGNQRLIDFRCSAAEDVRAVIETAHADGALVCASHPAMPGMGWTYGYDLPLDCMEVFHGPSGPLNPRVLAVWEELLQAGRRVVAVGASDCHCRKGEGANRLGSPVTWVQANRLQVAAILRSVGQGRVVVTERADLRLDLTVRRGDAVWTVGDRAVPGPARVGLAVAGGEGLDLRLVSGRGQEAGIRIDGDAFRTELDLDLADLRYVRAELIRAGTPDLLAGLTNPVWV